MSGHQRGVGFMLLSHELWQWILAALDSDMERVREQAYLFLLAEAPRVWEPRVDSVPPSGTGP